MLTLTPSPLAGALTVPGTPIPISGAPALVNMLAVKPRLGQWSKVLVGGPGLMPDESNALAVLYPVPFGGQADAFQIQDQGGGNTIDLSQIFIYTTIPGDTPMVDAFFYQTV